MSGLALQMDRSIRVGDWIKVEDVSGKVTEIRWRSTSVETRNWETIVIPNSTLVRNHFLVLGRRRGKPVQWRRWVWFNVDFRFPPSEVIGAVNDAIQAAPIEDVAAEPKPHTVLMDLFESYGRYAVRYWLTDLACDDPADSVIRTRVYFALKRVGIPLSLPAHTIFMTEDSSARQAEKSGEEVERRLHALSRVDFFDHLSDIDRARLGAGLRYAPFSRGEVMTKQGAEAHWLYLVQKGEASVRVRGETGLEREVARLRAGNFFGEMSLMTGAPRAATVVALTDVECYRLDKSVFQEVIRERPELAEKVAEILAQRTVGLEEARDDLDAEARRQLAAAKSDLLGSIRRFFGLASA
jgi:CRP-like cAMP-binding protein